MKKTINFLFFLLFSIVNFGQQKIDFTLRYNPNSVPNRYEVYARSNFTQSNVFMIPSQITVVTPSSVANSSFSITPHTVISWGNQSNIYAPAAQPQSDFRAIVSNGGIVNWLANEEKLMFSFVLAEGCVAGVRLFNNGVDPDSSQLGMGGGDFSNTFPNSQMIELYNANYNNSGTICQSQKVDLTVRFNTTTTPNRYEVYARPNYTQNNVTWGPSQITVVTPSSVDNVAFTVTSHAAGAWGDNSRVYSPLVQSQNDFHGLDSSGALTNFVANQEILLFSFTLPQGCVSGVRLFNNDTDPDSSQSGMFGGDFRHAIDNGNLTDIYNANYNNSGTICQSQKVDLTVRFNTTTTPNRYEVYARPNYTQNNVTWGPSQITVVTPSSVDNAAFTVTSHAAGAWGDNSRVYSPLVQSQNDFHGLDSSGALTNFVANQEILLFSFTLPQGCVSGVRLFNNDTDPDSSQSGMFGGDFRHAIDNGNLTDIYNANYNNSGTTCPSLTILNQAYFETGLDGWIDGGTNAARVNSIYSAEGNYSIELRSKSNTSIITTNSLNISSYSSVNVEFSYKTLSMESGEDFWLQYFNGTQWVTIATYASGVNFVNNVFYTVNVTINSTSFVFSTNSMFRFRCDASDNTDKVYLDKIRITGQNYSPKAGFNSDFLQEQVFNKEQINKEIGEFTIYPNPASSFINVSVSNNLENVTYRIVNMNGQMISYGVLNSASINIELLPKGVYIVEIESNSEIHKSRFVKN